MYKNTELHQTFIYVQDQSKTNKLWIKVRRLLTWNSKKKPVSEEKEIRMRFLFIHRRLSSFSIRYYNKENGPLNFWFQCKSYRHTTFETRSIKRSLWTVKKSRPTKTLISTTPIIDITWIVLVLYTRSQITILW